MFAHRHGDARCEGNVLCYDSRPGSLQPLYFTTRGSILEVATPPEALAPGVTQFPCSEPLLMQAAPASFCEGLGRGPVLTPLRVLC